MCGTPHPRPLFFFSRYSTSARSYPDASALGEEKVSCGFRMSGAFAGSDQQPLEVY